jgi:hypothetical protein
LLKAGKLGVLDIAEFHRRVENWYTIPGLQKNEIPAYAIDKKLTQEQVLEVERAGVETVAELENMVNAILMEAEEARLEERPPKKIGVPGKS